MVNLLPIGTAIANSQVYILDNHFQPVPVGGFGEICIGGAGVAIGYIGAPLLTAEKFIPDPFSTIAGSRLCRTGDRGRINFKGELEFAGRIDNQVKIRGYRIELAEIETVLSEHPSVGDVVVSVAEMDNGQHLVAYCVAEQADDVLAHTLRKHIKSFLPSYNVPAFFIWLEQIPLNVNGKVDRKSLPAPNTTNVLKQRVVVAPSNELETNVLDIWRDCLTLDIISVDDNFFDLGGHSLILSRIAGRLEQSTGLTVPLNQLFEAPSIIEQVQLLVQLQMSSVDEAQLLAMLAEL